ncbi:MAG: hypothetical protein J6I64_06455, partial [Lachnospiraceae bacterium]|nr:hypothetical protein [Lachnospiraceae bacterium]
MRNTLFRRLWQIPVILTAIVLTASFFPFQPMALAAETAQEAAEEAGSQAFLDFFGPDGVNDCLQPDTLDGHIALIESSTSTDQLFRGNVLDGLTFSDLQTFHQQGLTLEDVIRQASHRIARSQEQAVLTTVWENVGNGRINRKYLNGLVAFCFDEELAFPNGALYSYAIASDSIITGQAAAIAQRFGQSGVDNAQWWNECQVAIWAVLAGCDSKESASAFARSYCADRGITDADAIADYAHVVGSLVDETMGDSGTAYLYQAADPANQRILTFFPVWPDPAPVYPSPQYDSVSATESYTAVRHHSVSLQRKYAAITDETLSGAVFEIWEDGKPVGTITTDTSGTGSCSWDLPETVSSTVTKEYCSNYDKLDPETRKEVTGYTNREEAYIAAQAEAQADARTQAEADADRPRTVTIRETSVPTGFSYIGDGTQTVTLTGDDTASLSVTNDPWKATFLIDKVDGITGERIADETIFALYEWNGSSYQISSHYQVIRLTDGTYTVSPCYPEGQTGYLYYTQQNQGRFGLLELQAPDNYYSDSQIFYFEIHKDDAVIYGRNASPDDYPIADDTKFANLPKPQPLYADVTVTEDRTSLRSHQITLDKKTSAITGEAIEGAVFQVYEDGQPVGTITTDAQGMGNCQWTVQGSASITITETYCSNYDDLEPEEQARVTVFSSQEQALASAREQAASQAQALADAEADRPR